MYILLVLLFPPSCQRRIAKRALRCKLVPSLRRRCLIASPLFALNSWKNRRVTALLALAIICMVLELAGLLSGYTIHQKNANNVVSALAHLGGFSCQPYRWCSTGGPFVCTHVCSQLAGALEPDCREWHKCSVYITIHRSLHGLPTEPEIREAQQYAVTNSTQQHT